MEIYSYTGHKAIEKAMHQVVYNLKDKKEDHSFNWLIENVFTPKYFATIPERLKDLEAKDINQP